MNYEQQLDAARDAELNRYLDTLDGPCPRYDLDDEPVLPKFTTHTFLHELPNGELTRCVMTLNDRDEEDVRCNWFTLDGRHLYDKDTVPNNGCDATETLAYNLWWDLNTYERTRKVA